jgi:hypothetical protein
LVNQDIINRIEKWITKKHNQNTIAIDKYWQNEYHFKDTQPAIEDTKMTFYHSFATHALNSIENKCKLRKNLSQTSNAKLLRLSHVNEANLYFINEVFHGILISFESIADDGINSFLNFETIVRPLNHNIFHSSNSLAEKLLALQVIKNE